MASSQQHVTTMTPTTADGRHMQQAPLQKDTTRGLLCSVGTGPHGAQTQVPNDSLRISTLLSIRRATNKDLIILVNSCLII